MPIAYERGEPDPDTYTEGAVGGVLEAKSLAAGDEVIRLLASDNPAHHTSVELYRAIALQCIATTAEWTLDDRFKILPLAQRAELTTKLTQAIDDTLQGFSSEGLDEISIGSEINDRAREPIATVVKFLNGL